LHDRKLTLNGILVILIVFSAIYLFATITAFRVMDPSGTNDFTPIEDTGYAIRYSTLEPNGIVQGANPNSAVLIAEGNYGADWGAAVEDGRLYINKYRITSVGLMLCDVVKIDLDAEEGSAASEESLFPGAILCGRCASGELVLIRGAMLPANAPAVNALCHFYAMSDPALETDGSHAEILFFDPATEQVVHSIKGAAASPRSVQTKYLDKTLEEVKAWQ
jgi:hypothetical protein